MKALKVTIQWGIGLFILVNTELSFAQPDLVISITGPEKVSPDQGYSVDYTVENVGDQETGVFGIRFFLSKNNSSNLSEDRRLEMITENGERGNIWTVQNVGPSPNTDTGTIEVFMPDDLEPGSLWFLKAFVDATDFVVESDEENNVYIDESPLEVFSSCDFDQDGDIDFDDFFLFVDHFGTNQDSGTWDSKFDIDSNGNVGFDDFFLFADKFGS